MEDVGTEARPGGYEEGAGEHRQLLEAGGKGSPMGPPGASPAHSLTSAQHTCVCTRHTPTKLLGSQWHQLLA